MKSVFRIILFVIVMNLSLIKGTKALAPCSQIETFSVQGRRDVIKRIMYDTGIPQSRRLTPYKVRVSQGNNQRLQSVLDHFPNGVVCFRPGQRPVSEVLPACYGGRKQENERKGIMTYEERLRPSGISTQKPARVINESVDKRREQPRTVAKPPVIAEARTEGGLFYDAKNSYKQGSSERLLAEIREGIDVSQMGFQQKEIRDSLFVAERERQTRRVEHDRMRRRPLIKEELSMSLTSDGRQLLTDKKCNPYAVEFIEKRINNYTIGSVIADLGKIKIEKEFTKKQTPEDKLLLVLKVIKQKCEKANTGSISKKFYKKIEDLDIEFFVQQLMPNLAKLKDNKITIREKVFEDWRVLLFEVMHELIHLSEIDTVVDTGVEIQTKINKEIKNYIYLCSVLKEMFGEDDARIFVTSMQEMKLGAQSLFKEENIEEMSDFLKLQGFAIPTKTMLSYPMIIDQIFTLLSSNEFEIAGVDAFFDGIAMQDQNLQEISTQIKALIAVNMAA